MPVIRAACFICMCCLNFLDQYLSICIRKPVTAKASDNLQCVKEAKDNAAANLLLDTLKPCTTSQELF